MSASGTNQNIAFVDTETTSLRHDRRAWEIAVILRRPGLDDREFTWLVDVADLDLGNADVKSLQIGGFYDRHPQTRPGHKLRRGGALNIHPEAEALESVEAATRGAHLVGAVPSFDAEVLAARMRARGVCPSWHYHLIDFETLIVGYLAGLGKPVPDRPWRSDDLSRLVGVEPPAGADRHSALGDARWGVRVWDAIMGGGS